MPDAPLDVAPEARAAKAPRCAACGQPARDGRLTVRGVARHLFTDAFDLDRGLLATAFALLRRPGAVTRDYVRGRTVCYTGPGKYFVLLVTVAQLVSMQTGVMDGIVQGWTEAAAASAQGAAPALASARADAIRFMGEWFVALAATVVPLVAAFTRLLFRRAGYTYAEHLILALYVSAQQLLFFALVPPLLDALLFRSFLPLAVYLAGAFAYQAWAARQFFARSWGATLLRTAGLALLTALAGVLILAVVLAVLLG